MRSSLCITACLLLLVACRSTQQAADASAEDGAHGNRITVIGEAMNASVGSSDKVIFRGTDNEVIIEYLNAFFRSVNSRDVLIIEGNGNQILLSHRDMADNSVGSCDTIILRGNGNHIDLLSRYFIDNTHGSEALQTIEADSTFRIYSISETVATSAFDSTENKLTHEWLPTQKVVNQYEKSAIAGDLMALFYLGEIHQLGVGRPVDPERAAYYFGIAANKGQRDAQSALGYLHEGTFDGVPHDLDMARHWYARAAEQGDPFAVQRLKVLNR